MPEYPDNRVVHASPHFHEVEGATLSWRLLLATHGHLELATSGLARGTALVGFTGVGYVDSPVNMHNVRLRLATVEETDRVRREVLPDEWTEVREEDCLVIECDEGYGLIYADVMSIEWVSQPPTDFLDVVESPLWDGGPPLGEL